MALSKFFSLLKELSKGASPRFFFSKWLVERRLKHDISFSEGNSKRFLFERILSKTTFFLKGLFQKVCEKNFVVEKLFKRFLSLLKLLLVEGPFLKLFVCLKESSKDAFLGSFLFRRSLPKAFLVESTEFERARKDLPPELSLNSKDLSKGPSSRPLPYPKDFVELSPCS